MKNGKKLSLKKEKISSLTNSDMQSIKGGLGRIEDLADGSAGSSNNDFTCCWCTGGGNSTTCNPGPAFPGHPTTGGQLTCVSCP